VRISTSVISLVAALGLGACDVGSISGPGGGGPGPGGGNPGDPDAQPAPGSPDAAPPDFTVSMTGTTTATTLGTEVHYMITLNAMHGMTGNVMLTPLGVPASWQPTITPAAVSLDASGPAMADLKVIIPTDAADLTGTPGVTAVGAPGSHAASAVPLTVAKEVIVTIKDGTGTSDHAFPSRIDILVGTKLRVMDADTAKPHRIHSDATAADGFAHQDNDMTAGQEYDVTPTVGGATSYRWYCHDHGQGTGVVNLVVH
jgi:hypothetical protein